MRWLWVTGIAMACGAPRLPAPVFTGQPTSALEPVTYPPPPARVEVVPGRPQPEAVWLDGEWVWQARRWAWRPGRWVTAPAGARFAPWTSVRDRLGTLYVARGAWRDDSGKEIAEPEPLAVAESSLEPPVITPEVEDAGTMDADQ
jgi:hypothetical protein